jgi:phosphoribosylaminoimidazole carboxylase
MKLQRRRRLAYDGRGNAVVASADALAAAVEALGGYAHGLYAERWAPFTKARARPAAAPSQGLPERAWQLASGAHRGDCGW